MKVGIVGNGADKFTCRGRHRGVAQQLGGSHRWRLLVLRGEHPDVVGALPCGADYRAVRSGGHFRRFDAGPRTLEELKYFRGL
jgi:hypothetical protein